MEQIIKILSNIKDILKNQVEINGIVYKRLDDLENRIKNLEVIINKKGFDE